MSIKSIYFSHKSYIDLIQVKSKYQVHYAINGAQTQTGLLNTLDLGMSTFDNVLAMMNAIN